MIQRARIAIRGAVQGVGFRPFIYRLAVELQLTGRVSNSPEGVFVEVEGGKSRLDDFLIRLDKEKPPRSSIQSLECSFLDPAGFSIFEIRESHGSGPITALVLPDIATCADCQREIFDSTDRRCRYPFTNCTNCGPRFTIIESLPYDRVNTTMKKFEMCGECKREYANPLNRRFHAQPNGCSNCGPHLELWDKSGKLLSARHEALLEAAQAVREGRIVAVKGLGGFHLVVDARDDHAVVRLRERKHREEKPFALMYPSLKAVRVDCEVSDPEERLLLSAESPIVLLRRKASQVESKIENPKSKISSYVAPRNPYFGVVLPYTPLHHILLAELAFPVVATSGNLTDEPICTDEDEAVDRLCGIADLFLVHNRPIVRHVDDSVVRVMLGRELVLRRARGYAPLPIRLKETVPPALAVGGQLKNTVALSVGCDAFISQHIGDLETREAFEAFQKVVSSFHELYKVQPQKIICDMHPEYLSTKYAKERCTSLEMVQHHYAHVVSCMAENELGGEVLGVAWDGTGYGPDGTIWGGEFLLTNETSFKRMASLRSFRLPGGTSAIKEPRRTATGLLYEVLGDAVFEREDLFPLRAFTRSEIVLLRQMLAKNVNSPLTTSIGRLFDAVASLVGLRQRISFEGQAAMELEFALEGEQTEEAYAFWLVNSAVLTKESPTSSRQSKIQNLKPVLSEAEGSKIVIDWDPVVFGVLDDLKQKVPISRIAAKFHNALAQLIVAVAQRVEAEQVVLTGGCFQNKYLTERAVRGLEMEGFRPYWHQRVPPNDGGIALGQIFAAARATKQKSAPEAQALRQTA